MWWVGIAVVGVGHARVAAREQRFCVAAAGVSRAQEKVDRARGLSLFLRGCPWRCWELLVRSGGAMPGW
ncbi:hypothetical protein GCM10012275_56950 [Longimycelium tulufanense]|uniref:Uncharacterized protein n=1 Tax=Longimycelium tulufanense TaxID=907463 RepID=A0A8J3CJV5_9PSEU|nr:hypothetical protein GCM10012275_56950 [Longimycelium tulufanense]